MRILYSIVNDDFTEGQLLLQLYSYVKKADFNFQANKLTKILLYLDNK